MIGKCKSLIEAVNSRLISTQNSASEVEHTNVGLEKKRGEKSKW